MVDEFATTQKIWSLSLQLFWHFLGSAEARHAEQLWGTHTTHTAMDSAELEAELSMLAAQREKARMERSMALEASFAAVRLAGSPPLLHNGSGRQLESPPAAAPAHIHEQHLIAKLARVREERDEYREELMQQLSWAAAHVADLDQRLRASETARRRNTTRRLQAMREQERWRQKGQVFCMWRQLVGEAALRSHSAVRAMHGFASLAERMHTELQLRVMRAWAGTAHARCGVSKVYTLRAVMYCKTFLHAWRDAPRIRERFRTFASRAIVRWAHCYVLRMFLLLKGAELALIHSAGDQFKTMRGTFQAELKRRCLRRWQQASGFTSAHGEAEHAVTAALLQEAAGGMGSWVVLREVSAAIPGGSRGDFEVFDCVHTDLGIQKSGQNDTPMNRGAAITCRAEELGKNEFSRNSSTGDPEPCSSIIIGSPNSRRTPLTHLASSEHMTSYERDRRKADRLSLEMTQSGAFTSMRKTDVPRWEALPANRNSVSMSPRTSSNPFVDVDTCSHGHVHELDSVSRPCSNPFDQDPGENFKLAV